MGIPPDYRDTRLLPNYTLYAELRSATVDSRDTVRDDGVVLEGPRYRLLSGSAMILMASVLYSINGELYKAEAPLCTLWVGIIVCVLLSF